MKLVRDNIPKIIKESGNWCLCKSVKNRDDHVMWLVKKMTEEVGEFVENPSYEEAGDILEVLRSFVSLYGLKMEEVIRVADGKKQSRGGFDMGVILEEVGR